MIAVDTSALLAVILKEPERNQFLRVMRDASKVCVSTVILVETSMVVNGRRGQRGAVMLEDIFDLSTFEIVPPGLAEMDTANRAFIAYGKGSGHPAQLNFGDLFSYALAKVRDVPLLFKGNDFSKTDIRVAT